MSKIPLSYKRADFASDQEVKWCPGCGDYTILASVQNFMTELVSEKKILCLYLVLVVQQDFLTT